MKKSLILTVFALMIVVVPSKAHAFSFGQLIDPACVFACDNSPKTVTRNITTNTTNSNNVNSNINSTVTTNNTSGTHTTTPAPIYVYDYNYNNTPNYPTYPTNNYQNSPLGISCYSTPTSGNVGDSIMWGSSAYGGNGNYYITWSGNDGLSGYGSSISKIYYSSGSKYASVTATSGGQTVTQNCSNNVEIYNYNNNYYPTPTYPTYNNNYNYNYSPLYVSCSVNNTFAPVETNVVWNAYASGGNGSYTYRWNGTDYINGYGNSLNAVYHSSGTKTASVTVYSGNQTITQICSNSVLVGVPNQYYGNNYYNNTYTPPPAPVVKYVNTTKPVRSHDNSDVTVIVKVKTGDHYDEDTKDTTVVKTDSNNSNNPNNNSQYNNSLPASPLFSLSNVPWGLVAILVILVLLFTVIYLIFNKNKI